MNFKLLLFMIVISSVNSRTQDGERMGVLRKRSVKKNECISVESRTNKELHEFGEKFAGLAAGLEKIQNNFTGDVILFVGNTGAGKSSLVHILAGESSTFVAQETDEETGDFYLEDITGRFVKNSTIDSTTIYPEALVDAETGVVLFDTPGFRDTRSAIHEIVATYGLRRVAEVSQRIKIALLVNHESLTPFGTRDDFINTLESFFSLFKNNQKFIDSTYLVATKVQQRYIKKKGQALPVTMAAYKRSIVQFLHGVKNTLQNHEMKFTDKNFTKNAQALIARLTHANGGDVYEKIALFMKPDKGGPITNSESLQQSVKLIREVLLVGNGYVDNIEMGDFGFTISDAAKLYIRNLYDLMNSHIVQVSKSFTPSFNEIIESRYENFDNIETIQSGLQNTVRQVGVTIQKISASQFPHQYVDAILNLANAVELGFCNKFVLNEIKQLDGYLDGLKNITGHGHYTPKKWSESLYDLEKQVKSEGVFYNMLDSLYKKLTDYSQLFSDYTKEIVNDIITSGKQKIVDLFKHLGVNEFVNQKLSFRKEAQVRSLLISIFRFKELDSRCNQKTLVILGSFLRTSDLNRNQIAKCSKVTTVVLYATKKLFIDANIGVDILEGRNLVIISPEWHVKGWFTLSVDGDSKNNGYQKKAEMGKEGLNGEPGFSAGKFVGVGMKFINSNWLTISASGGDGQNGQDGGDGEHGKDGHDGSHWKKIDDDRIIYVLYNTFKESYLIKAEYGTKGGNAGSGGFGGPGGQPGSVEIHSLSKQSPDLSKHRLMAGRKGRNGHDGSPGLGGLRGCDMIVERIEKRLLFIPVGTSQTKRLVDCVRRNPDGVMIPRSQKFYDMSIPSVPPPPPICTLYKDWDWQFEKFDDIVSHLGMVEFRKLFHNKFGC